MSSKKKQDLLIQKLRDFQKSSLENKRCADCGDFGPTFICMNFGTFVCTGCSGLHRELSHRVKGITLSEWTEAEIDFICLHGNNEAKKYLVNWDPKIDKRPETCSDTNSWRQWIRQKYKEKKWYQESSKEENITESINEVNAEKSEKTSLNSCRDVTRTQGELFSKSSEADKLISSQQRSVTQNTSIDLLSIDIDFDTQCNSAVSTTNVTTENIKQSNFLASFENTNFISSKPTQNHAILDCPYGTEKNLTIIEHFAESFSTKENSGGENTELASLIFSFDDKNESVNPSESNFKMKLLDEGDFSETTNTTMSSDTTHLKTNVLPPRKSVQENTTNCDLFQSGNFCNFPQPSKKYVEHISKNDVKMNKRESIENQNNLIQICFEPMSGAETNLNESCRKSDDTPSDSTTKISHSFSTQLFDSNISSDFTGSRQSASHQNQEKSLENSVSSPSVNQKCFVHQPSDQNSWNLWGDFESLPAFVERDTTTQYVFDTPQEWDLTK